MTSLITTIIKTASVVKKEKTRESRIAKVFVICGTMEVSKSISYGRC